MPFTKEYLKDYEEKIRKLPLEELYDILSVIRDNPFKADDTLERVNIVEKRIEELENKPQSKGKSNSSTRKYYNIPYKKSILIVCTIIEICAIATIIIASEKAKPYHIGFVIDEIFLDNLAKGEFYRTIQSAAISFSLLFGIATGYYAYGRYKTLNKQPLNDPQKLFWGIILLPIVAVALSLPRILELPTRNAEKPRVQIEKVIDKKSSRHRRGGTSYYLIFSSRSKQQVSQSNFESTPLGKRYYTFYQGDIFIGSLTEERFVLKVPAKDLTGKYW